MDARMPFICKQEAMKKIDDFLSTSIHSPYRQVWRKLPLALTALSVVVK
jgi:hypothetical protein